MANDPNFSCEHYAAAAPDVADQSFQDNNITEQFLLSLIRFVQYGTRQPNLTPMEQILMNTARDVFQKLATECDSLVHANEGSRSMCPEAFSDAVPLSENYLDQSVTAWPELNLDQGTPPQSPAKKKSSRRKKAKKQTAAKKTTPQSRSRSKKKTPA